MVHRLMKVYIILIKNLIKVQRALLLWFYILNVFYFCIEINEFILRLF